MIIKKPATTAKPKLREATIRMYDVGFGDAFLLTVPNGGKTLKILFDCGSVEASPVGGAMKGIVKKIIADATDADGIPRIDVVVATHRHKDHVSGFADQAWDAVEVQEVWMPWTEHPTNADARRIREMQSKLALGLAASSTSRTAVGGVVDENARALVAAIADNAGALSNAAAMKRLHGGFAGNAKRRFLPESPGSEDDPRTVRTDALPGVGIHVLGPSRDPEVIRDMNPPKGESYLGLLESGGLARKVTPLFAPEFVLDSSFGEWTFGPDDRKDLVESGNQSELAVAVALDQAVNGTSLMLILDLNGTMLLFPGDAQWGTWKMVLQDEEWSDLLKRLSFYKIGHHGSHNATPTSFVKRYLPVGCCAMASTLTRKIWPDIPRPPLLAALEKAKTAVARSDELDEDAKPFTVKDGVTEIRIKL